MQGHHTFSVKGQTVQLFNFALGVWKQPRQYVNKNKCDTIPIKFDSWTIKFEFNEIFPYYEIVYFWLKKKKHLKV